MVSFEQDSPNENVLGNFDNFLDNIETKKDKLADIKKEISGLEEEEDLYDFNDDEDYDYDKVDDDVEIEKLYDVKKEHDQTITDIEKLLENEENSVLNVETSIEESVASNIGNEETDEERMTTDEERMTTDEERMTPDEERMTPDEERMTPDEDGMTPDEERMTQHEEGLTTEA